MRRLYVQWIVSALSGVAVPCVVAGATSQVGLQAPTPGTLADAVVWLQGRATKMIHDCRRSTQLGIAAFPPQVGGGYEAFWLRDYAYMLEGDLAAFSPQELRDAYRFFLAGQRADGAMVDCIKFDGTPCYMPGYGTMGKNPVADGSQFMVDVAWYTYQSTGDKQLVAGTLEALIKGMKSVPRNPVTGLVHIQPGPEPDRCAYGFTDAVCKQGDELFCSLLFVQASRQLSDLLSAVHRRREAAHWRALAREVQRQIQSVFWNEQMGLFRAATLVCNQPDIWGSAFAVHLGVASPGQSLAVASYFKKHYSEIVKRGQLRHLPGSTYWEQTRGVKPGTYQNGAYWATPIGWFVETLDLVDPMLADRTVVDLVRDFIIQGDENECINEDYQNVPHYVASVVLPLQGIRSLMRRRASGGKPRPLAATRPGAIKPVPTQPSGKRTGHGGNGLRFHGAEPWKLVQLGAPDVRATKYNEAWRWCRPGIPDHGTDPSQQRLDGFNWFCTGARPDLANSKVDSRFDTMATDKLVVQIGPGMPPPNLGLAKKSQTAPFVAMPMGLNLGNDLRSSLPAMGRRRVANSRPGLRRHWANQ